MGESWIARRMQAAARSAGLTGLALLFLLGAVVAALIGAGVLLAQRFGTANAAFIMAGVLFLVAVLILVILQALRPKPSALASPDLQRLALAASLRLVSRLSGRQVLFLAAGSLIGVAAFLFGAGAGRKK
jgi:cbb3-type cytochrome oxidase subunit 3